MLKALRELRQGLLRRTVTEHCGEVIKSMGDGWLVEFGSVVDAVNFALQVQENLAGHNIIKLRIGIHIGDIVHEDEDIYGDGVNIAARLQEIASPGGVAMSGRAWDFLDGKLANQFQYAGKKQLKNIAEAVRVFTSRDGETEISNQASNVDAPLSLPDKPSIAVLPFDNMSSDPEQEYFADGMTEDIIAGLSKCRWLFVIARNSTFAYKGMAADVRAVGRELGVRYVLEGSVRRAGNRVRISGQLIEAASGAHLWAERYDRDLTDIFELQDEITNSVVAIIEPALRKAEIERVKRKRPDYYDAYDLYLRALAHMYEVKPESRAAALGFVEHALKIDPNYAEAHGVAAWCYFAKSLWEGSLPEPHREAMLRHGRAVQERQTEDASTLAHAAIALALATGDYDAALAMIDRAISINPSSAHAYGHGSVINTWAGYYDKSIELSDRALRLSPLDPLSVMPLAGQAGARMMKGQYDEAVGYARRALQVYPTHSPSFLITIASLMCLGRKEEARAAAQQFLAISPTYRIIPNSPVLGHFVGELRDAGLPG